MTTRQTYKLYGWIGPSGWVAFTKPQTAFSAEHIYRLRPNNQRWAVVLEEASLTIMLVDLYEPSLSQEPIPLEFPAYREFPTLDAAIAAGVMRL